MKDDAPFLEGPHSDTRAEGWELRGWAAARCRVLESRSESPREEERASACFCSPWLLLLALWKRPRSPLRLFNAASPAALIFKLSTRRVWSLEHRRSESPRDRGAVGRWPSARWRGDGAAGARVSWDECLWWSAVQGFGWQAGLAADGARRTATTEARGGTALDGRGESGGRRSAGEARRRSEARAADGAGERGSQARAADGARRARRERRTALGGRGARRRTGLGGRGARQASRAGARRARRECGGRRWSLEGEACGRGEEARRVRSQEGGGDRGGDGGLCLFPSTQMRRRGRTTGDGQANKTKTAPKKMFQF